MGKCRSPRYSTNWATNLSIPGVAALRSLRTRRRSPSEPLSLSSSCQGGTRGGFMVISMGFSWDFHMVISWDFHGKNGDFMVPCTEYGDLMVILMVI